MIREFLAAAVGAFLGALFMSGPAAAQSALFDRRWDPAIAKATKLYWPAGPDWRWWKAQLFQESGLRPDARSPVGAAGLAQVMPATWREIAPAIGLDPKLVPPVAAVPAIEAGAFYMARLSAQWRHWAGAGAGDALDVHRHAQAGYNAGSGHVLRAWRLCGEPRRWADTVRCLPQVTGRHAAETATYVERIARWRAQLESRP